MVKKYLIINLINIFIPYFAIFVVGPYLNFQLDISFVFLYMILAPIITNSILIHHSKNYKLSLLFTVLDYVFFYFLMQHIFMEALKDVKFF